ncbi:hypothetical protein J6590_085196 [Homalodisca vitripennis]|nr:hypothetical protein J6590_085196 [Homalodisca vitripennis]
MQCTAPAGSIVTSSYREMVCPTFSALYILVLDQKLVWKPHLEGVKKAFMTTAICHWFLDVHSYETRGRGNYRTGRHRTVVYEHLPSLAGVHFIVFIKKLPNWIKNAATPKVLKTRLRRFLGSQVFYNITEVLAFDWKIAQSGDWLQR